VPIVTTDAPKPAVETEEPLPLGVVGEPVPVVMAEAPAPRGEPEAPAPLASAEVPVDPSVSAGVEEPAPLPTAEEPVLLAKAEDPSVPISPLEGQAAPRMVIVQPGYPGSTKDAEGFMATLTDYLAKKMKLPGLAGEYHNDVAKALEAIHARPPIFGLVSLGFYLEHRRALGLEATLVATPEDHFVIVARPHEVPSLAALRGQPVAGGPLAELRFLDRVVFGETCGIAAWDSRPTLQVSRVLRELANRKEDPAAKKKDPAAKKPLYMAVVLTGRDYEAFKDLYSEDAIVPVEESESFPPSILVTFHPREADPAPVGTLLVSGGGGGPADGAMAKGPSKKEGDVPLVEQKRFREKLVRAFEELSDDPKGKVIVETMGTEGFEEFSPDWLKDLDGKYDGQVETK
jgi:hypothetical protein